MKKIVSCVIAAAFCALVLAPRASAMDAKATQAEIVEAVEKATGCGKDALDAVMKESPQLFENVGDTVTAIKVVNMVLDAKDVEAVAEVVKWELGKELDVILKRVLPAPWLSAISAFKAYYAALELIRDYLVVPAFDERLYRAYKAQRSGAGGGTPEAAFTEATVLPASGYYLVKPSMLEKYIKARGWKKDVIGENVISNAEKQIDNFWQKRLEARYQKDMAAEQAAAVRQTLWAAQANNLAAIRAAAEQYGNAYPFFLSRGDVDALDGFQFSEYTYWPPSAPDRFRPVKEKDTSIVIQAFQVIPEGITEKKDEQGFPVCYDKGGKRMDNGPHVSVSIQACPRIMTGEYQGKPFSYDLLEGEKELKHYDTHPFVAFSRTLAEPGMVYGHLLRKESKDGSAGQKGYIVVFFTDKLRVIIGVDQIEPYGAAGAEALILQIMRVVLGKMTR